MNAETRAKEIGMTPEQRARDLMANAIPDGMDEASFGELDEYLHTRIAAAIRSAENDKLEEAADAATKFLVGDPFNGVPLRSPGPHEIAAHIRSLKLKD